MNDFMAVVTLSAILFMFVVWVIAIAVLLWRTLNWFK